MEPSTAALSSTALEVMDTLLLERCSPRKIPCRPASSNRPRVRSRVRSMVSPLPVKRPGTLNTPPTLAGAVNVTGPLTGNRQTLGRTRSEEHTAELQAPDPLACPLPLE